MTTAPWATNPNGRETKEDVMDAEAKSVMEACTAGSDAGDMIFPVVVQNLVAAGVERYRADLLRGEKIYYLPNGESHRVACHAVAGAPAREFSAEGVEAAVRAIQRGGIRYAEFCDRIAAAGCVDYLVSLAGRRAVYYGRTGDCYVERFPPAD